MQIIGWIALDIDGTITANKFSVPKNVCLYLETLAKHGWQIVIVTGRTFSFATQALSEFHFPYLFCAQNGSIAFSMPEKKILSRNYLSGDRLKVVKEVYQDIESDFLVYSGMEKGDFCYWRPQKFNDEQLAYLEDLKGRQREDWHALDDFDPVHIQAFPLLKCFGEKKLMGLIEKRLQDHSFTTCLIQDPFDEEYHLLQVTGKNVSKGACLKDLHERYGKGTHIIAAGDDNNDLSMLKVADERIVMPTAPDALKEIATILSPPVEELGIITSLNQAIAKFSK